jgi:hypothetical protein
MKRVALLLLFCAGFAIAARAQAPCCSVTAINAATGIVSAKVNANGEAFQFKVANANLLKELRIGTGVYANFTTHEVSLDGKIIAGPITAGPASAPVPAPAARPAVPSPASPPLARPAAAAPPTAPASAPSAEASLGAPQVRTLATNAGNGARPSATQLSVMTLAMGTVQRSAAASPSAFSGTRPRFEARTLAAAVSGNATNAHIVHLRGLDGIEQAQGLPDGVKELLMMHVKTLAAGESDDYIVNTDLAGEWAKTHTVSAAVKKTAQDTDSHTGCKSFSMHCAGEAEEHAAGQASDVLKQAKDDWDHSASQLGHDWGVSADQIEACFADHVTNPADIPVEFSLNLPSLITLDSNDVNTVLKAIKVVNQINSGQSPLDVATGASKPNNSSSNSGQASGDSASASPFSGSMKGQIVFGFPLLSSTGTVVHADFSYIPCLAFVVRPHSVGVSGTLNVETAISGNAQLNGQYSHTISLPPADLHIPLQVLPIVIPPSGPPILEMDLSLFVQGFLQITGKGQVSTSFNLDYAHSTDFDFTCNGKGCVQNRAARSQVTKVPLPPAPAATTNTTVSGEILIQPKVFTGLELNVEFDALQARVGPEATMEGDVQGDACLATNGASRNTSDALLAELGWTPSMRADTLILNKQVGDGYDHPLEQERLMAFQDLLQGRGGSTALTPAVSGLAKLTAGQSAIYNIKMPSCYPYTQPVTYHVTWTGGVTPGVNSPGPTAGTKACAAPAQAGTPPSELNCVFNPKQALALSFAWPKASATDYTIKVEAIGDELGRKFTSAKPASVSVSVAAK